MRKERSDGSKTRQLLVAAAAEVFAKKGYRDASNADIAQKAGTNTAAVNYHFGSKDDLYIAAWKHACAQSLSAYPPDGGVSPTASAEERLAGYIRSSIKCALDPATLHLDFVYKEMACPTGILDEAMFETGRTIRQAIHNLLLEMLGADTNIETIGYWYACLISLTISPTIQLIKSIKLPKDPAIMRCTDADKFAEHVVNLMLAGIRESLKK